MGFPEGPEVNQGLIHQEQLRLDLRGEVGGDRSIECFPVDPAQSPLSELALGEEGGEVVTCRGPEKVGVPKADGGIQWRERHMALADFGCDAVKGEGRHAVHLGQGSQHNPNRRMLAPGIMETAVALGAPVPEPLDAPADQGHAQPIQTREEHGVLHATYRRW